MRVVAGLYRGRRLRAPSASTTRPTAERVREALFDILGAAIEDARVLDCYAGSGALGIEALSRGAARVVFVERARGAVQAIRANLTTIGMTDPARAQILSTSLEKSPGILKTMPPFDLWLVDPPFAMVRDATALRALTAVLRAGVLDAHGLVVLEYPSELPVPLIGGLHAESVRPYGDTNLAFLHR